MFLLKKILTAFILPPGIFIVILIAMGLWAWRRKNKPAALAACGVAVALWLSSAAPIAGFLMQQLESGLQLPSQPQGDVIILLGGAVYSRSPDLTGVGAPGPETMQRLVTAVRLQRRLGVPIVVSGGRVFKESGSIAQIAGRFLIDLGVAPEDVILEAQSRDTYENARFSKAICDRRGFNKPLVVTSAYHIKRALLSFEKVGLKVAPYPCCFSTWPQMSYHWYHLLPSAASLHTTYAGLHEMLGLIYYRLTL